MLDHEGLRALVERAYAAVDEEDEEEGGGGGGGGRHNALHDLVGGRARRGQVRRWNCVGSVSESDMITCWGTTPCTTWWVAGVKEVGALRMMCPWLGWGTTSCTSWWGAWVGRKPSGLGL